MFFNNLNFFLGIFYTKSGRTGIRVEIFSFLFLSLSLPNLDKNIA